MISGYGARDRKFARPLKMSRGALMKRDMETAPVLEIKATPSARDPGIREKQRKNAPFECAKRSKQRECLRVDARLNF